MMSIASFTRRFNKFTLGTVCVLDPYSDNSPTHVPSSTQHTHNKQSLSTYPRGTTHLHIMVEKLLNPEIPLHVDCACYARALGGHANTLKIVHGFTGSVHAPLFSHNVNCDSYKWTHFNLTLILLHLGFQWGKFTSHGSVMSHIFISFWNQHSDSGWNKIRKSLSRGISLVTQSKH